jgi:hypothetical protein
MRTSPRIVGTVLACLFVGVLVSAGCAKKTPVTVPTDQTTSAATSVSVEATVAPTAEELSEPITTPAADSVTRKALMDAARRKLGTTSQFVVYQLYVQGDRAISDLETVSGGKRQFVAFKGPEWEAEWVTPFGSASASSASAKQEVPGLSSELLARIDWNHQKPASSAAMVKSLTDAAKTWSKQLMEGQGEPYKMTLVKVAQDPNGAWWGRAIVQPTSSASSAFEPIDFWCKYTAGAWEGKPQDPEPPAPTTYFPASVVGSLGF